LAGAGLRFEDEKVKSTDEITEAVMDTLKEEILVFTPKGT